MDRRVKERLVGATILVVAIVLIVPELLSGPKQRGAAMPAASASSPVPVASDPVRNVTVDLATSKATAAEDAAASAASAQAAPVEGAAAGAVPADAAAGDSGAGAAGAGETGASETGASETGGASPAAAAAAVPEASAPTITTLRAQRPLENPPTSPKSTASTAKQPEAKRPRWAVQVGSFASRVNAEKLARQIKAHDSPVYVSASGKGASLRYRVRMGPLADRAAAERAQVKLRKEGHSASLVAP